MSHLSDTLNRLNKNNYSARKISDLARLNGHKLDNSTVSRYLKGDHPEPAKQKTLVALAAALGVDVAELESAAGVPISGEPFILPPSANTLNRKEREVILRMVEVLTDSKQPIQESEPPHPEQSDMDLAADETNTEFLRRRTYFDELGEENQDTN